MPLLHVVILAAGQGKRMQSALPKVLHRIAGRPLLAHVVDAARALKPELGSAPDYRIEKGSAALRSALIDFLVAEFKGERQPADSDAYEIPVRIEGHTVNVSHSGDFGYVMVSLAQGDADTTLVRAIASRFDAALATGRYDALFGK